MVNIIVQDNGYKLGRGLLNVCYDWEDLVESTFENIKEIEHFYYGTDLIMTTVRLSDNYYGHFTITQNGVSFNGHTCTAEQREKFESCTWNDELYDGKLYK